MILRLTVKDGVLQDYYDHQDDFPVCREQLDYISFSTAADPLIRPDGQRLFNTQRATVEVGRGAGANYAFTGAEVVDEIRNHELNGLTVDYAIIYREDWLFLNGTGGPWSEDVRILSPQELAAVRAAIAASNLKSKNTVKLIQLFGARVRDHRGDSWYQIRENPDLMAHLANFDGIGTECHIGDWDATIEDGPQTLDVMALIAKWATDHNKTAFIFMGGTAASYVQTTSMTKTYDYLWNALTAAGVAKDQENLLYFRQGARVGTHLPESQSSLTSQVKWLIQNVAGNLPPTISAVADQTIQENGSTAAIPFTIGDDKTPADELVLTATSSNINLLPEANIVLGGNGTNRTVMLTSAPNQSGSASVTLTVRDMSYSASSTFLLTVTDDPNFDGDGDGMSNAEELLLGRNPASASDLAFEFNTDDSFNGWGGFANITNQSVGSGSINGTTITGDPQLTRGGFLFDSAAVPSVIVKLKASAAGGLQFFWGNTVTPGFAAARRIDIPYTAENAWQAVIVPLAGHVEWDGQPIASLRIDPIGVGGATFEIDWIRASDGDLDGDGIPDLDEGLGDGDGNGLLDIEDPNNEPTISGIADIVIDENSTTGPIPFTIGDPETAAALLTLTKHSSNPTLVPLENIVLDGSNTARTVTVTPAANQTGTATITLTASDGYLSATESFELTVPDYVAIANGPLTNAATWGIPAPVVGDMNSWKTGSYALTAAAGASAFHAHTLAIQTNGELNTSGPGPVLSVNHLVLDGGSIANLNNTPFRILLGGKTLTLNSGTLKSGSTNNGRDLRFENGSLAGSGTVVIQNVVITGAASGSEVDFTGTIDTEGFSGVFDIKNNGLLNLPPIANASFGLLLSGSGKYWNDAAIAVTTLKIAGHTFPAGTYTYANIGAAYQPYLGNNGGTIIVTQSPEPYTQWAEANSVAGEKTDDDDGDGLLNLAEYALGGNPANPADHGHVPAVGIGTAWLDYVHVRRSAPNSGVTYTVEVADGLVAPVWTTNGVEEVGTGPLDDEFNTVTNRISTETKNERFIRLIIE